MGCINKLKKVFEILGECSPYKQSIIKSKREIIFQKITRLIFYTSIIVLVILSILVIVALMGLKIIDFNNNYWLLLIYTPVILLYCSMILEAVVGLIELSKHFSESSVAKQAFEEVSHDQSLVSKLLEQKFDIELLRAVLDRLELLKQRKENKVISILGDKNIALSTIILMLYPLITKLLESTIANTWFFYVFIIALLIFIANIVVAFLIKSKVVSKYIYWQEIINLTLEKTDKNIDVVINKPTSFIDYMKSIIIKR